MTDLSTAILRVLVAHREQYPLVTGGLAPCVTCHTPYPCAVAEALEPVRRILALPVCQNCGMRHEPGDKSTCIEGHGDDPVHGRDCPIAQTSDPMSCTCEDTTARDNYLPSRRGTGCKSCGVWSPERLTVEEFAMLPHQFGCPLDPDYEPASRLREGF